MVKENIERYLTEWVNLSNEYQDRYYLKKYIQAHFPSLTEKTIYNIIEKSFINSKGEKKILIKELVNRINNRK